MQPTPSSPSTSSSSGSIQRLSSEYDGWWISSGVPSSRRSRGGLARALGRVGRDADVERLALAHRGVERADGLLQRRVRVEAVRVEDVDVVEPHALRGSGRARRAGTCASPTRRTGRATCRSRPWCEMISSSRYGREVLGEHAAEVLLGRAVRRAVVVGEVEVRDAEVERAAQDRALALERLVVAEVVPQAERDGGELEAAAPAAAVGHRVVAVRRRRRRSCPHPTKGASFDAGRLRVAYATPTRPGRRDRSPRGASGRRRVARAAARRGAVAGGDQAPGVERAAARPPPRGVRGRARGDRARGPPLGRGARAARRPF